MKARALLVAWVAAGSVASAAGNPVITHAQPNALYSFNKGHHVTHDHMHLLGANLVPPWDWADGVANHVEVHVKVTDGSGSHTGGSGVSAKVLQFSSNDLVIQLQAYTANAPLKSLGFRVAVDTTEGQKYSKWFEVPVKPPPADTPAIKKLQPASFVISPQTTSYKFSIWFDNVDSGTTATVGGADCNSKAKTNVANSISEGTISCEVPAALRKPGKLNVQVANAAGYSPFAWLDMIGVPKIVSIKPSILYVTAPQPYWGDGSTKSPPPDTIAADTATPPPSPHKDYRKVVVAYTGSKPTKVEVNNRLNAVWSPLFPKDIEYAGSGASLGAWIYKGVVQPQNPFQEHQIKLRVSNEAGSHTGTIWVMKGSPKGSSGGGSGGIKIPPISDIKPPGPGPIGDSQILKQVQAGLADRLGATGRGLNVSVSNGVVTLIGRVKTPAEKQSATVAALKIAGVKTVQNKLQVAAERR